VVKRRTEIAKWCKLIAALGVCASIACSQAILPQLIAQLASLDHGVSLHATSDGVHLILTHDGHASPAGNEEQSLALSTAQPAHIIHLFSGPATAKQSVSRTFIHERQVAVYFLTVVATDWRKFVPPLPLVYSHPPPDELSIPLVRRSTLLLI
jgi:hypothetical protein